MNPTSWSLQDGHLLQSLRTKAGVDAHVFARTNTISLAQLQELENGEGRSFYNELIKRNTGIKLLKKLGYEFPVPLIQVGLPVAEALHAGPDHESASLAGTVGSADVHKSSFPQPILRHPLLLTGGLLTVGLLGFMGVQHQDPAPSERSKSVVLQTENTQHSSSAAATASSTIETSAQSLASVACDEQHRRNSLSHTPQNPLKPGNYIYIEARTDSQLCVLDSQNKMSILSLKAGTNQTVNGSAPFLLHASNWQGVQVFFQGRPVRVEHSDRAHLMLNSLPI